MRILYDGEIFRLQRAGGINRIFAELIGRLPPEFEPTLTLGRSAAGAQFPRHPRLRLLHVKRARGALGGARALAGRMRLRLDRRLSRFDIVHPTYYSTVSRLPLRSFGSPVVVTIYDLIHERFPRETDPDGRRAREKAAAIATADLVVCISESTRRDLLERFPLPEERVRVVYPAGALDPALILGREPVPARPYLLFVGSRAPYKSFDGLLRALSRAAARAPDLALAVVGPPLDGPERSLVASLGLEGRIEHMGVVPDRHLARLYSGALALAYPSLYEGFGIPPLEAMSLGTPVIASRASSIPEVVGDAGLLCEPGSDEALADAILRVVEDATLRADLSARGRARAALFSWERMAREMVEVYRGLTR